MNWATKRFDYYLDGELIKRDLRFRTDTVPAITRLHLYNYHADTEAWWDDIRVGVNTLDWLRLAPAAGRTAAGGSATVTVTASAAYLAAGAHTGHIVVRGNDPAAPEALIPVNLSVVSAPGIHLPDTAVDFGPVVIGGTATRELRIANSGTEPLVVSALQFSDPVFASDQALPLTIEPGARAVVTLRFTPAAATAYAGQLAILSNSPAGSPAIVALAGSGPLPPDLEVDTEPLEISVPAGLSATGSLTIANAGAGALSLTAFLRTAAVTGGGAPQGAASISLAGGPDGFGYTFRDERDPDGPMFQWEEIAAPQGGPGTELTYLTGKVPPSDCNQPGVNYVYGLQPLFAFPFYGTPREQFSVSAYGTVFFDAGPEQGFGCYIGSVGLPVDQTAFNPDRGTNAFISAYLDRLKIVPGAVYTHFDHDRAIIQWYRVTSFFQEYATFQIILYPNGDIRMQWYETGPWLTGSSAIIGIQGDAFTALQYGAFFGSKVAPGRCIYYTYPGNPYRDWLRAANRTATVAPGGAHTLQYEVRAQYLLPGTYHGAIELRSNDPGQPVVTVPVVLTVTDPTVDGLALVRKADGVVVKGAAAAITQEHLYAASPVAGPEAILYRVADPGYGMVRLNGAPADQFTQADLAAGRVSYLHDGSDGSATTVISFTITDGVDSIGPCGLTLTVSPVNDPPVITGPAGFTAASGLQENLDGMMVDDPDISHPYANWRLTLAASHGVLHMDTTIGGVYNGGVGSVQNNGTKLVTVETWLSRLQTNFGTPGGIRYTPDAGFTGTDTLRVTISDNGNTGAGPQYAVSRDFPVTVHATDYARWQHLHFDPADLADPAKEEAVWGDFANPDRDAYPNLLEYLLARDPLAAEAAPALEHGYDGVHLWLRFPVRLRHPGVTWRAAWSATLDGPWSTAGLLVEELETRADHKLMQARVPLVDPGAKFIRLEVSR